MRLLFLLFFVSHFCNAQIGFFGKKNILEVNAHGNVPVVGTAVNILFGGSNELIFKAKGDQLLKKRDWFNYGVSLQNFHYFKKSTGIGLQLTYDFQNTAGPYKIEVNDPVYGVNNTYIDHEMLKINTLTIMPKLEIGSLGSHLPSGLSHQFGIGFTMTSIVKNDYLVKYSNYSLDIDQETRDLLNKLYVKKKNFKGFSLLYQMNYRTPLTKFLFLNWGMRYSFNLCALGGGDYYDPIYAQGNPNYDESLYDLKKSIQMTRLTNVVQLTLGLGFSY